MFLRKNEVVLRSLHTSRLEIFATKVDGSYSLTVGLETFIWGLVGVLFLGEGSWYCLLVIIIIILLFVVYLNNSNLNNWFMIDNVILIVAFNLLYFWKGFLVGVCTMQEQVHFFCLSCLDMVRFLLKGIFGQKSVNFCCAFVI